MNVKKAKLTKDSQLHASFKDGDFLDCYAVRIERADAPITEIAQRIFIGLPRWVNALLAIRDISVAPFGLKTTARLPRDQSIRASVSVGDHINFFCVRSITENEIILGEDDLHLDFKISVCRDSAVPGRITLATWVRSHNRFGKFYLGVIAPFHAMIVSSQLSRLPRHFVR